MRPLVLIAAASVLFTAAAAQEDPGTGALLATIGGERVALPVTSTSVELTVTGTIVRGVIEQRFENPADVPLEAIYLFPLPEGAAVDGLTLTIAGRRFAGEIREKEEARRTYERAKESGKRAGLVEQHRPNLFRTAVAGIPAGETVMVRLSYLDDADFSDGTFSTTFPLTITPRYAPGGADPVCSGGSVTPPASVRVRLDAGFPLASVGSPSHGLTTSVAGRRADLSSDAVATDRDLVLRWTPRSDEGALGGALVEDREDGRYFSVTVIPPSLDAPGGTSLPTQTVFVVDVSGSMQGPSIEQAREALLSALGRLAPGDTFALIKFDDENEAFREGFSPATESALAPARAWVRALAPGGGTEILPALLRALEMSERGDARALRRVVLITDGAVGNEEQVLAAVERSLGATRLHVVGIGPAPNRWLMTKLARSGRGAVAFIGSTSEVKERIDALLARTERAVLKDVAILGLAARDVEIAPDPIPDVYAGRPLVLTGRLAPGAPLPKLALTGRAPNGPVTIDLPVSPAREHAGIGVRWARARVEALEDARRLGADPERIRLDVIDLAKRFSIVTPYTSFVVVEDESPEAGIDELPPCGTLEPLLLAIGAGLTLCGLALLARGKLA